MVKHIVMWKFKPNDTPSAKIAEVLKLKSQLEKLEDQISVILGWEVGLNIPTRKDNYDLVLYSEFRSVSDLESYLENPDHQALVASIKDMVEHKSVVDFII